MVKKYIFTTLFLHYRLGCYFMTTYIKIKYTKKSITKLCLKTNTKKLLFTWTRTLVFIDFQFLSVKNHFYFFIYLNKIHKKIQNFFSTVFQIILHGFDPCDHHMALFLPYTRLRPNTSDLRLQ